jgi:hypothetical protein
MTMTILKLALLGFLRIAFLGFLKVALFVYAFFLSDTFFAGAVAEGNGATGRNGAMATTSGKERLEVPVPARGWK